MLQVEMAQLEPIDKTQSLLLLLPLPLPLPASASAPAPAPARTIATRKYPIKR